MTFNYYFVVFHLLMLQCLLWTKSHSTRVATIKVTKAPTEKLDTREHILLWERCERRWDPNLKRTRRCCRGNYSCAASVCVKTPICRIGFFSRIAWCFHDSCGTFSRASSILTSSSTPIPSIPKSTATPLASSSVSPLTSQTPTPLPSASKSVQSVGSWCSGAARVRRDIRDLNEEELRTFQDGILRLNSRGDWGDLSQTHHEHTDGAHGGAYFLPWHRLQLHRLENLIRDIMNAPTFSMPFWDWSKEDSEDAALSEMWNAKYMGKTNRSNNGIIETGQFQNLQVTFPFTHRVQRNFTSAVSGELQPFWDLDSLRRLIHFPYGNWEQFNDGIEASHALVHLYVGGDMSDTITAPNDPLFYLHHAFVDSLLHQRLSLHGPNEFSGTHDFQSGTVNANDETIMNPFNVDVQFALELDCIQYIPYSGTSNLGRGARNNRHHVEHDDQFCEELANHQRNEDGLSVERCRNGAQALRGNSN